MTTAKTHQPCPDCGSSDALTLYEDGNTHCFSCNKTTFAEKTEKHRNYITGKPLAIKDRGIQEDACKRYSYTTKTYKGRPAQIATYKDLQGVAKWQKVRFLDTKEFVINKLDKTAEPLFFGMHLFAGGNKKLYITEGEIDCLSVSQVFGNRYAIVSIPMGAQNAPKAIKHNIEWLSKFDEITLIFDNDDVGREAVLKCAELLPVGTVKIVTLPYKDPNEMLQKGLDRELESAIWRAREYRPDGIISGQELWDEIRKPTEWGLSYPFPTLTELTYGLRIPEYNVIGAGTGIGKTTYFTAFEAYFILNTDKKVGVIHLEQQLKETCLYLMSCYAKKALFRPDVETTEDELKKYFDEIVGQDKVFFYNAFGTKDFQVIKNIIRYLAVKQGCEIIFLDHITALGSGVKAGSDVNQTMKNISSELASLTRELNFSLLANSHLRKSSTKSWEDGAKPTIDDFEGSGDITKWANFVFAIQRNKNAGGVEKNVSYLHCLKDRYTGKADGAIIPLIYDPETCALSEHRDEKTQEEFTNDETL